LRGSPNGDLKETVWFQSDHERFLAAIAAALLGAQGSPVWTQTAEALLLDDPQVKPSSSPTSAPPTELASTALPY
jgi:hypothetical protein